jgi:CspA family cold shock protein
MNPASLVIDVPAWSKETQRPGRTPMLKTIRKFVRERSRDVHRRRRPISEDDDTREPSYASDAPQQSAEQQLDEPPAPTVWGKVKWYNPLKRYGFVELSDGSGDAFLHATALADIDSGTLQPGVRLEFRLAPGQRGPQVTEVLSVDTSTAAPSRTLRKSFKSAPDRHPYEVSVQEMGTVKWYNASRGFGFIIMDGDAKEVFVHATALDRAGIAGLNEGQRVYVGVTEGRKGPEAASIQLA